MPLAIKVPLLKVPVCILCGKQFNTSVRKPFTQKCQHSTCSLCLDTFSNCPIDKEDWLKDNRKANQPLVEYLSPELSLCFRPSENSEKNVEYSIEYFGVSMANFLKNNASILSPQLSKRMLLFIQATFHHKEGRPEFVRRISSLFGRLLLELVQAQYDTKQKEKSLIRLIRSKGCTILHPNLTDKVIDYLVRLYDAASVNTAFERGVLIKYLLKELSHLNLEKRQVELIVQTLYRASCFHVIKLENEKVRFKLKEDLCNANDLRQQHDVDLIKLAQAEHIRLPPESWARLLYSCPHPDIVSKMQSLLDKYQTAVTVEEVKLSFNISRDSSHISKHLDTLKRIEDLLSGLMNNLSEIKPEIVVEILENLEKLHDLFSLRQRRNSVFKE